MGHTPIYGSIDKTVSFANPVTNIALYIDVGVSAERFFEPQVRRRDFLLYVLVQLDTTRISVQVLCCQVL